VQLACECGYVATAEDQLGLVRAVRQHGWAEHNVALSVAQVMALVDSARARDQRGSPARRGSVTWQAFRAVRRDLPGGPLSRSRL